MRGSGVDAARQFLDFGIGPGNFAREPKTKPDPKKTERSRRGEAHFALCGRGPARRVLAGALARFALVLRVLATPDRIKALSMFSLRIYSFPRLFFRGRSKPYARTTAVFVDELDAGGFSAALAGSLALRLLAPVPL